MSEPTAGGMPPAASSGPGGQPHTMQPGRDVIIFGYGRSGTTWIAQVIARTGMELVFEPLYDREVPDIAACKSPYGDLSMFWYLDAEDSFEHEDVVRRALGGQIRNAWTLRDESPQPAEQSIFPQGTPAGARPVGDGADGEFHESQVQSGRKVVKVIRANLMVDWIVGRLPFNPVFVIRNPLSVVASAFEAGWYANRTGYHCRKDLPLFGRHLEPFRDWITSPLDQVELLATTWCINNYVPKKLGVFERYPFLVYDELLRNPLDGFHELAEQLHFELNEAAIEQVKQQSFTGGGAARQGDYDPTTAWKKQLSTKDADRVMAIVERFSLSEFVSA